MKRKIQKLLIANRGEIACRVMATAKRFGISTVAVYSDADANAQHVLLADEALHIGPAPSKDSYLNMDAVINAALLVQADAIHPGYGFLSENADFADRCVKNDILFVGPSADAIRSMGSKSAAKIIMEKAGVPLLPGYHGDNQDPEFLKQQADQMGYPVLLKAVAGGGGKGMRQVASSEEFDAALETAKREAMSSFGDDVMLLEKFLTHPRHVEVQVFFDNEGQGVYLFERDCSLQRRHQKIIEEAPAPGISEDLRRSLGEAAVRAGEAIHYTGAGTVEFLLDTDGTFYFMEMNTRLQVEHPVTELITGEDLVEWQLRVAEGQALPKLQSDLNIEGHAFEARLYAEDPDNDFLPQTGTLTRYVEPDSSRYVRVDSGVVSGDEISVYYDPMIAKLICWDIDRSSALNRLSKALNQFQLAGITTNRTFLERLARHPEFQRANLTTAFIDTHAEDLQRAAELDKTDIALIALYLVCRRRQMASQLSDDPWVKLGPWRMNAAPTFTQCVEIEGEAYAVKVEARSQQWVLDIDGERFLAQGHFDAGTFYFDVDGYQSSAAVEFDGCSGVWFGKQHIPFCLPAQNLGVESVAPGGNDFRAPMNGTVVSVAVSSGAIVVAGEVLVVMEAMKMEHVIKAPVGGRVTEVMCAVGDLVDGGSTLLAFEADNE